MQTSCYVRMIVGVAEGYRRLGNVRGDRALRLELSPSKVLGVLLAAPYVVLCNMPDEYEAGLL